MNNRPPLTEEQVTPLVAAFVAKNWDAHYRGAWEAIGAPTGLRDAISWNWAAALFSVTWLAYRRRYLFALATMVMSIGLILIPPVGVVAWLVTFGVFGLFGDKIILGGAIRAGHDALEQFGPGEKATQASARAGGVSLFARPLFGTFFVLFYLAMYGLLTAPSGHTKARGYRTQLISDLKSLSTVEEQLFTDSGRYSRDVERLFSSTSGVNAPIFVSLTDSTWSATATHRELPGLICGVAVGVPNPVLADALEGEVVCK